MKIDESTYKNMPPHLQELFEQIPNPDKDEVLELLPYTYTHGGAYKNDSSVNLKNKGWGYKSRKAGYNPGDRNEGSAARFFYTAKSRKLERNEGCDELYWEIDKNEPSGYFPISKEEWELLPKNKRAQGNIHPTVKPLKLLEYLCKLTSTPTGGIVLDPFMGSGTTGKACIKTNRSFIGIEINEDYFDIAQVKIDYELEKEIG